MKVLIVCNTVENQKEQYKAWVINLQEHLGNSVHFKSAIHQIETPYAIFDFVSEEPESTNGYNEVFKYYEQNTKILKIALGEGY